MVAEYGYTSALLVIVGWKQIMKLNKYINKKITEDDVEEWIAEWYKDVYDREPPTWLCGKRWYDRRQQKIDEA